MKTLKDTNITINTKTLDDYIEVLTWAFDQGMVWADDSTQLHRSYWQSRESEICVNFRDKVITYASLYYYKSMDITIISVEEFYELIKENHVRKIREEFGLK